MSLNAEMLSDEVSSPDAKAMLDTIGGEIRRLERLTELNERLSRLKRSLERLLCSFNLLQLFCFEGLLMTVLWVWAGVDLGPGAPVGYALPS